MNNQKKLLTNTKFSSPKKRCWINTKKKSNKINSQWFTLAIIHGIYVSWSRISKWRRRCVWKAICTLAVLCWNCQKLKVSRLIRYKKKLFQKLDRNKKKKWRKFIILKIALKVTECVGVGSLLTGCLLSFTRMWVFHHLQTTNHTTTMCV